MPDPSPPPDDATRSAERAAEVPSESAPVPVPPDDGAPTVEVAAGPDRAETADPDALTDPTEDVRAVLSSPQQPDELGRLGRYRVLRVLGRGGMGVVFEAEDERLKRRVAIKAMLPALAANPSARRRFVREAETAARVTHDNIVPIYDIADANGVPFIAMPLLVGESLDSRLKQIAPLAVPEVLTIGREVALGLAAAHTAGLIHRDIKPGNVWLERTAEGEFRRARILDFGLARLTRDGGELTHSGAIMGTPAYMAPEQARGQAVDPRADLFSLGCVLYQMATGRRPFAGADTFAVLTALATETPVPPIALNPAVPPALSALIEKLLAKNPADRWPQTAREVADELLRIARAPLAPSGPLAAPSAITEPRTASREATEPLAASRAESPQRPRRPSGRGPLYLTLAVVLGGLAIIAALFGGAIVRYANNEGQLRIETDDPDMQVTVERNGMLLVNPTTDRRLTVPAGDGEVRFYDSQTHAFALARPYSVERGGRTTVRVTLAQVVAARNPAPKKEDPRVLEIQRALKWVHFAGGTVHFRNGSERFHVAPGGEFPKPPFTITAVEISGVIDSPRIEDLRGMPPIEEQLILSAPATDGRVLGALSAYPGIRTVPALTIHSRRVGDSALVHLQQFPNLGSLDLSNTATTDEGLQHLALCSRLTRLDLRETKVTESGAEKLAEKLPKCRIEYDGGIIEPK